MDEAEFAAMLASVPLPRVWRRAASRSRDVWRAARSLLPRARRGWAPADVWDMKTYLPRVAGEMVAHLREQAISFPATSTPEEWAGQLDRVARPLLVYAAAAAAGDETSEQVTAARAAFTELGEVLQDLWD